MGNGGLIGFGVAQGRDFMGNFVYFLSFFGLVSFFGL